MCALERLLLLAWPGLILPINGSGVARQPAEPSCASEALTPREMEVLCQIVKGPSNREIAAQLTTTKATIKTHVSSILSRLHVANRVQTTLYALQEGAGAHNEPSEGSDWASTAGRISIRVQTTCFPP